MPIRQHLGIRPDEPPPATEVLVAVGASTTRKATACDEYVEYLTYAQQLQEAYHARATHNRSWIYAAGLLGLGALAASGGLAVVGAATAGTLGLLTISGGFSAGAFATVDNSTLAELYTIAANKVDAALAAARKTGPAAPYVDADVSRCKTALDDLREKVSEARIELEEARTDSAKASLVRAAAALETLRKQVGTLGLNAFDVSQPTKTDLVVGDSIILVVSGGKSPYTVTRTPDVAEFDVRSPTKANNYLATIEVKSGARETGYDVVVLDSAGHSKLMRFQVKATTTTPPPPVASKISVEGVPKDGDLTITQGQRRRIVISKGEAGQQYTLESVPGGLVFTRSATANAFQMDSKKARPGIYTVTVKDSRDQEAVSFNVQVNALRLTEDTVRKTQEALRARSFDPKGIDGVMGKNTSAALKGFQRQQGLEESGTIDIDTLQALGL
jgi:hypothetical protein